jgi:hypothetical protein
MSRTKHTEIFDQVMSALNGYKAMNGGAVPAMKVLLERAGVKHSDWYAALSATRESSPTMVEIFYKALGYDSVPEKQTRAPRKPKDEDEQEQEDEPDADEDDEPWTPEQVLASVLELFAGLDDRERGRILRSVATFHEISL